MEHEFLTAEQLGINEDARTAIITLISDIEEFMQGQVDALVAMPPGGKRLLLEQGDHHDGVGNLNNAYSKLVSFAKTGDKKHLGEAGGYARRGIRQHANIHADRAMKASEDPSGTIETAVVVTALMQALKAPKLSFPAALPEFQQDAIVLFERVSALADALNPHIPPSPPSGSSKRTKAR